MDRKKTGALLVALSALGFGTIAIFAKLAYNQGVDTYTMLTVRFTIGTVIIWTFILATRLPWRIKTNEIKQLILVSILGYGGGSTLFFLSIYLLPASLASMLLYTYPVMVALVEAVLYRQPLSRAKAVALLLSSVGLVLILGANFQGISLGGAVLALSAAGFYTAYLIYGKRVSSEHPPLVTTGYILLFAAAGYLVYSLLSGSLNLNFEPAGWFSIIGLGMFGTALAIFSLFAGMKWLEPSSVAIISTIEPVFTVICAALLFAETVLPLQMAGGVMVLTAILIVQRYK